MSINFLPWRQWRRQRHQRRLCYYVVIGLTLVIVGVTAWQLRNHQLLARQTVWLTQLRGNLQKIATDYTIAVTHQRQQQVRNKQLTFLTQQGVADRETLMVLQRLGDAMPSGVYLTSLQRTDNKWLLIGKSPSHADLANWMQQVASLLKTTPELTETAYAKDQAVIDFSLMYEASP